METTTKTQKTETCRCGHHRKFHSFTTKGWGTGWCHKCQGTCKGFTRGETTAPTYQADGFRDERCNRCGEVIGFAFFDARIYGTPDGGTETIFTHRERSTYEFPEWCRLATQEGR